MPLSTTDLIAILRDDLDDPEMPGDGDDSDCLWLDTEFTRWLAEGQEKLCRKLDLLFDASSFSITTDAAITTGLYAISDDITKIRSARVAGSRNITVVSVDELKRQYSTYDLGWYTENWQEVEGEPQFLVTDVASGFVQLVPRPATGSDGEVINLTVYRMPTDSAAMEVPNRYRRELLLFAKYKAYDKNDSDVHNEKLAMKYKGEWENTLIELALEEKRRNKNRMSTSYGGIEISR